MYLALFLEPFFIKYHITVILIAINFCLLCFLIFINRQYVFKEFKKISVKVWFLLFLILILAVILRILIPHRQYPLIYDETFYFQAAVDMFRFDVLLGYSKSIAWPFVLSLIFKFFTPSNNVVFNTSIFFAVLALMFSFIYFKYREKSLLWLSIIGLALSVQFRPENIGLFVIFFMF